MFPCLHLSVPDVFNFPLLLFSFTDAVSTFPFPVKIKKGIFALFGSDKVWIIPTWEVSGNVPAPSQQMNKDASMKNCVSTFRGWWLEQFHAETKTFLSQGKKADISHATYDDSLRNILWACFLARFWALCIKLMVVDSNLLGRSGEFLHLFALGICQKKVMLFSEVEKWIFLSLLLPSAQ